MKIYFKYYGEALAKVAVGGFLIGMGAYLASDEMFPLWRAKVAGECLRLG